MVRDCYDEIAVVIKFVLAVVLIVVDCKFEDAADVPRGSETLAEADDCLVVQLLNAKLWVFLIAELATHLRSRPRNGSHLEVDKEVLTFVV